MASTNRQVASFAVRVGSALVHGQQIKPAGATTAVIFLHAGVADSRMFSSQIGALPDGFSAVSYDRRGYGQTTTKDEPFSQVDDLHALIQTLNVEMLILVGCSQGARIAIDYRIQFPDRVEALVLVSAAYSGAMPAPLNAEEAALISRIEDADAASAIDEVNGLEAHLWLDGPRSKEGRVSGAQRDLFLDMNGIALRAPELTQEREPPSAVHHLADIPCPVLLVEGDQDLSAVHARHNQLESKLSNCRRMVLQDAAHLVPMEQPCAFNRLLNTSLTELD